MALAVVAVAVAVAVAVVAVAVAVAVTADSCSQGDDRHLGCDRWLGWSGGRCSSVGSVNFVGHTLCRCHGFCLLLRGIDITKLVMGRECGS